MAKIVYRSHDTLTIESEYDRLYVLTSLDEVLGAVYNVVNTDAKTLRTFGDRDEATDWAMDYCDAAGELDEEYDEIGDGMTDVEADADTLRSCGWGTDEDYGFFGEDC